LRWFEICQREGGDGRSIPERLKVAVHSAGARRGLQPETRKTYANWVARFGCWAGTERRVMDPGVCREWLTDLVEKGKRAFSTQKQALNALVFFYREVCGMEEVELGVKMRKGTKRVPVLLDKEEVLALIAKLEPRYRTMACLQYGAGLRVSELARLRIKDVDLKRGILTVRKAKRDKDRMTVIPECLKEALAAQIAASRTLWEQDRAAGVAGVSLLGAELQFPKSGVKWAWHWLFPAADLSVDPESGIERRHHILAKVYGGAVTRAAGKVLDHMRVTSHCFRHSFSTHFLEGGADIRTLQDLLGHEDVTTTEIYAHAVKLGNDKGIQSPLDMMGPGGVGGILPSPAGDGGRGLAIVE
jgi:integron integrase